LCRLYSEFLANQSAQTMGPRTQSLSKQRSNT
jgi:hypothetical protein